MSSTPRVDPSGRAVRRSCPHGIRLRASVTRSRWPVTIVASLMLLTTMASNAPSPLYGIYQERFHLSALDVTGVFSSYAAGVILVLFVVGGLSDVVGRRRVLIPSLMMLGVSAALFAAAEGAAWLFAARAVQGLGTGGITGAATAALVELEPNRDRKRASYINTLAFVTGAASGPLLFGIMAEYLPWPTVLPFLIEIALVALTAVGMCALPETVTRPGDARWAVQRPSVPRPVIGPFVLAALALSVAWGVGGLFAALSSTIDRDLLHIHNHAAVGLVLFVFYGAGGISQITLRCWPPWKSIAVGVSGVAIGMALVYWGVAASNVPIFLVGTPLTGAGGGLGFMGSLALVNEVAPPARRAEVVSAWNLVGYVFLSTPVIGVGTLTRILTLKEATGIFTAAIVAMSIVTIVMVLFSPRQPLGRLSPQQLIELGLEPAVIASGTG